MKRRSRALLIALALALGLILVREQYAPRLTLHVKDALRPTASWVVSLDERLALQVYTDTRPHVGKIAALQKGLVLVDRGDALIEEGYGFGLPIVEVSNVAYLARHAEVSLAQEGEHVSIIKAYTMDVADRPLRLFRTKYQDVMPLGVVVFSYTLRLPDSIDVMVDFTGLNVAWERVYLMNEQGARTFTRYREPTGEVKQAGQVGIWQAATAPFGCWEAPERDVAFCVDASTGQPGFVGRERYRQYNWLGFYTLSWSGIDLEIEAPQEVYTYTIHVQRRGGQ